MSCGATTSTSMRVPFGYKFRPTDKELLKYLQIKMDNLPLPCDIIKEVELYKFDPSELLAQFGSRGEEKCYFFTSTYRKYPNGTRPSRSTKNGFWKASTGETEIKNEVNNLIGTMRSLVFYCGGHGHEKKTNWIMHEYKLNEYQSVNHIQIPIDPMKLDKWVLCSIYENSSASARENRKRKAIVLSEELATTSKKREIVLHQAPLNGNQENDQISMVPSFDNLPEEFIPNALYMGCDIPLTSDADLADYTEPMEMLDRELTGKRLDTTGKSREIVSQQGPLDANQENVQSMVPLFDNPSEELIPNASSMGCDNIAPLSDIELAEFAELMEMLDREPTNCYYPPSSSSS